GDSNHDNRIFTLATLLCSTLVYNMKGAFDQDAVNKLTFVSEMSKNIKYGGRCDEENKILQCILPGFVLALRDFSLKLIKDGREISEDQYLEMSLESKPERNVSFNKPRECIRQFFPKERRKCFAFPVPGDGDILGKLDSLRLQDLSQMFQDVATNFVSYIFIQEPKRLEASKPVNGCMFATLTKTYVDALKRGAVPDVDDTFAMVAKTENERVKKQCMLMFHSKMNEIQLPLPKSALKYMRTHAVKDVANVVERDAQ
ncbi:GBP3-like protein, partial [Mya arenaria]